TRSAAALSLVRGAALTLGVSLAVHAQQAEKVRRIGVLTFTQMSASLQEPLRQGLRENGYVEGQNLLVEWRAADGRPERAKTLAQELVRLNVEGIVADPPPPGHAGEGEA